MNVLIYLVEYADKFATYSNVKNKHAFKLLDRFARRLFPWRRPYPNFRQSQVKRFTRKTWRCHHTQRRL